MRIIQLFNWNLKEIENELDNIKRNGFDTIQINPMQPFKETNGFNWWASYQPLDFKIGNMFGTKSDLENLCQEANKRNLNIVVDVVCNHLANDDEALKRNKNIPSYLKDNDEFWKVHPKDMTMKTHEDEITKSIGLPGLNLKNKELQKILFNYLDDLKKCGVAGFRIDAAKHIGLPSDGVDFIKVLGEYCDNNDLFAYGEVLDASQEVLDEYTRYIYVLTNDYDKVTNKEKVIPFVESHDTFLNDYGNTRDIAYNLILKQYYALTKKYENSLFYVRDGYKPFNPYGIEKPRKEYSEINIINDPLISKANRQKRELLLEIENMLSFNNALVNMINYKTTLEECKEIVILNYRIQLYIYLLTNSINDTELNKPLLNSIATRIYNASNYYPLFSNVSYNEFYEYCLEALINKYDNYGFGKTLSL